MSDKAKIDRAAVRQIAHLARLEMSADEIDNATGALGSIIGYIEQLTELDTSATKEFGIDPAKLAVWREDDPQASSSVDDALSNAPEQETGYIRVPPIVGQS